MNCPNIYTVHKGIWGTVCQDYFGEEEAKVVCRMLGFPPARRNIRGQLGINAKVYNNLTDYHDTGPIWINLDKEEHECSGDESHLEQCKPSNLWEHDYTCNHTEDVAVTCE